MLHKYGYTQPCLGFSRPNLPAATDQMHPHLGQANDGIDANGCISTQNYSK